MFGGFNERQLSANDMKQRPFTQTNTKTMLPALGGTVSKGGYFNQSRIHPD